jgi:hypothetical protein
LEVGQLVVHVEKLELPEAKQVHVPYVFVLLELPELLTNARLLCKLVSRLYWTVSARDITNLQAPRGFP